MDDFDAGFLVPIAVSWPSAAICYAFDSGPFVMAAGLSLGWLMFMAWKGVRRG